MTFCVEYPFPAKNVVADSVGRAAATDRSAFVNETELDSVSGTHFAKI
jgi:hypothetical protein